MEDKRHQNDVEIENIVVAPIIESGIEEATNDVGIENNIVVPTIECVIEETANIPSKKSVDINTTN